MTTPSPSLSCRLITILAAIYRFIDGCIDFLNEDNGLNWFIVPFLLLGTAGIWGIGAVILCDKTFFNLSTWCGWAFGWAVIPGVMVAFAGTCSGISWSWRAAGRYLTAKAAACVRKGEVQ